MSTAASPTPDLNSKPIEIELGNGMVIKGANLEEAIANTKKIVNDNVTAYRTEREKREQAEAEAQQLRAQIQQRPEPPPSNGYSKERYYQLLNEDPIAAQNYIDQIRFGVQDPVASINQMRQQIDTYNQQAVVASFLSQHPDFPGGADTARTLTQRFDALTQNGFPINVDTLNYAYQQAIADGSVKPLEVDDTPDAAAPNPSLVGSSGINESDIAKAEQMNDADLAKFLRSKGMNV